MRILITGVAGFVGSTLSHKLSTIKGWSIFGIDNFSYGYRERLEGIPENFEYVEGDVFNLIDLLGKQEFDAIIHCSAIAPLPECEISHSKALAQNIAQCGAVTDYARFNGTKNVIFFSSGAVYEGVKSLPQKTDQVLSTSLCYPTSKLLAEKYFETVAAVYGLNILSLRLFNLYGERQDYFRSHPPFLGYLIKSHIEGTVAEIYSDGKHKRDYIYIDDLCELIQLAMGQFSKRLDGYNVINVGSEISYSVDDIIEMLSNVSGRPVMFARRKSGAFWEKYDSLFTGSIPLSREFVVAEVNKDTLADCSQAFDLLGWRATVSMPEGIKNCYDYAAKALGR